MTDKRDILVKCRQQAAVCKAQDQPEVAAFLTALADEIEQLRFLLALKVNANSVPNQVNGNG